MPVDAVTIGHPIRVPCSAAFPSHHEKYVAKAEEKFARVTVACIGQPTARRLLWQATESLAPADHTVNQTVLARLRDHKHEGKDHDTIQRS
jgi:hypothetical protein